MFRNPFNRRKPWCTGHRGIPVKAPENTIKGFMEAQKLGADGIELDVRLTKDRKVVVIHDAEIDRTSNGTGRVRDYTLEELKQFDFGEGEKIPTLDEVLNTIDPNIIVNIEIKEPDMVKEVIEIIRRNNAQDRVLISSFIQPILLLIKKQEPRIKTGVLFGFRPINIPRIALESGSEFLNPYYEFVDKTFVEEAHKAGIGVLVWTVDKEEDIRRMIEAGVDGIITNNVEACICIRKQLLGF